MPEPGPLSAADETLLAACRSLLPRLNEIAGRAVVQAAAPPKPDQPATVEYRVVTTLDDLDRVIADVRATGRLAFRLGPHGESVVGVALSPRGGLVAAATSAGVIVWSADGTIGTRQNIGHVLFVGGAFSWACFTVAMRRARLDGLHAAAIAAVGNLVLYLPVYAVIAGASLFKAPLADIALQAFVQGFLTAVISLLLYGRAVSILGASGGAAFPALCPALTAVLAIPILGEWPTAIDWIAIILISAGVYVVSGGPLSGRRT